MAAAASEEFGQEARGVYTGTQRPALLVWFIVGDAAATARPWSPI